MNQPELKRLKELEQENGRLKKIVAQQAMDIDSLKKLLGKEWCALRQNGNLCDIWWLRKRIRNEGHAG